MLAALAGPLVLAAILVPFRGSFPNTDAALAMLLVVVAVAAIGNRVAGYLAALSAAVWFDFFLTRPYQQFAITRRADIETTVLLLVIGVAVTEIAVWGWRQQAASDRRAGYLDGITAAAAAVAAGEPTTLIEQVSGQLTRVLGLKSCRWQYGVAGLGKPARLMHNGDVMACCRRWTWRPRACPAATSSCWWRAAACSRGDPDDAGPGTRPTLEQRLVAIALADQVGSALGGSQPAPSER